MTSHSVAAQCLSQPSNRRSRCRSEHGDLVTGVVKDLRKPILKGMRQIRVHGFALTICSSMTGNRYVRSARSTGYPD